MNLISSVAEKYAEQISTPNQELLQVVYETTLTQHAQYHMLSSNVQGNFLSFISCILQPTYILEIGSFTGYSALCLAKGLTPKGQLHTIELRENDAKIAKENFSKSLNAEQLILHQGNAIEIIPTLNHKWDLVFIDADKTGYIDYYEMIVPSLSDRGIIIADNVLFHGQIFEEPITGKNAKAIEAFNKHVLNDNRTEQVLLTIRDGLLMIKKK